MMTSFVYMVVPKRRGLKDRSEKLKVNDENSVVYLGNILAICFRLIVGGIRGTSILGGTFRGYVMKHEK